MTREKTTGPVVYSLLPLSEAIRLRRRRLKKGVSQKSTSSLASKERVSQKHLFKNAWADF